MGEINNTDLATLSGKIDVVNTHLSHMADNLKLICERLEKHEERLDNVEKELLLQKPYKDIVKSITRSLYATISINAVIVGIALWIVGGK